MIIYIIAIVTIFILLIVYSDKNYNKLVIVNVFLLSFAIVEPSPSDILFVFIFIFLLKDNINKLIDFRKIDYYLIPIFFYIITNIFSFYYIKNYFSSFKYFAITIYLILYSLTTYFYLMNSKNIKIIKVYIYGSTISALIGIIGYLGFLESILKYDNFRVKSLFKDPNVFGPFLIPSIIILLDYILDETSIKRKIIYIILLLINLIGVIISFSRGAWINLIVSVFIYILLNIKRVNLNYILKKLTIFLLIIIILWNFILSNDFKDFLLVRAKVQHYDFNRFLAQKSGLMIAFDNFFGYGPGQYENTISYYIYTKTSAHSLYMRVLLENGFLGFIVFIISIFNIIIELFKNKSNKNKYVKNSVLLPILIGILVNSIVVDTLHWRHFWFFIGISLYNITLNKYYLGDYYER